MLTIQEMNGKLESAVDERQKKQSVDEIRKKQTETAEPDILEEAAAVVSGDRNHHYGHPADNHGCTADLWRVWIRRMHGVDIPLTAEDVCWLHILEKASRDANRPKLDNLTDTAGYAKNIQMIREAK